MPQDHPFRPHAPPPQSSRSTETPMDFVYDRAPSSSGCLSAGQDPPKSSPSKLNMSHQLQSTRSLFQSSSPSPLTASPEPPRKRMHYETESMDWESCPVTHPDHKPNLFPNPDSTRALGGTFLFNPPSSLPLPPVYTHPSSTPSLPSPTKFRPESYGLYPSPRNVHQEDNEADSSLDVEHVVLQPAYSSKMYSNNAVRHENRRRTRAQKQIRSKLSQLSFNSDEDDADSDVEVISNQENKALVKKSKNRQDRTLSKKRSETTTNNYLTINGWKGSEGTTHNQNQSYLSTNTPYTLLVYLQLLFNASLVFGALYIAISIILNIRTDINHKFLVHTSKLRHEIEICTKEYNSNRCFPVDQRTKFIEKHCIEWESCMNRNPNLISRSKIAAETFAEAINGFVDMISWKTMIFIILSVGAGIYATNLAMNTYKSKWEPPHHHKHQQARSSPWRPRFLSSPDRKNQQNGTHSSIDPMEIFGQTSKIFSSNHNYSSSPSAATAASSDLRKNR